MMQMDLFGGGHATAKPPRRVSRQVLLDQEPRADVVDYDPPDDLRSDLRVIGANLPPGWQLVADVDEVRLIAPNGFCMTTLNSPPRMWFSRERPIEVATAEAERICKRIVDGTWSPWVRIDKHYAIGRELMESWLERWRAGGWKGTAGNDRYVEHLSDRAVLEQFTDDLRPPREAIERAIAVRARRNVQADAEFEVEGDE